MTTDILCRFDAAKREGVVFLADTMQGNQIQAWNGTGNPQWYPLDYYHMTGPLSAADEKVLMERFKQATNRQDQVVKLRQRLPRTPRPLPNMLSPSPEKQEKKLESKSGDTIVTEPPVSVAQATPADVMNAIAQLSAEFNSKLSHLASLLTPKE